MLMEIHDVQMHLQSTVVDFERSTFRDGKFMVGKIQWFNIAANSPHKP